MYGFFFAIFMNESESAVALLSTKAARENVQKGLQIVCLFVLQKFIILCSDFMDDTHWIKLVTMTIKSEIKNKNCVEKSFEERKK